MGDYKTTTKKMNCQEKNLKFQKTLIIFTEYVIGDNINNNKKIFIHVNNNNNNNNSCEFSNSFHYNEIKVTSDEVYKKSATCIRQN
jgi:hypothetical protein